MTPESSSWTSSTSGREADRRREPGAADRKSSGSVAGRVILGRSHWSKFLAGTPFAIPAQFNRH
ncbi:MAG: hypothetical protein ACYC99_04640 [Candidatus Geothermincolia bacterium]